jgi:tRNA/tmRNA/rRNA uracil-C5-methylase (TrmA/RlmC/RlmD family)
LSGAGRTRDRITARIDKLVGGGRGRTHHDGRTWFVEGGLPGELALIEPLRRRAGIVEARTIRVIDGHHPSRESAICPHAPRCGGCDWPHVNPAEGAALKVAAAAEAARSNRELAAAIAAAAISTSPPASRIRARLHWDPDLRRLGFYESRSHAVSAIDGCRILSPHLHRSLEGLQDALACSVPARVDLEWIEGSVPEQAVAALRPARGGPKKLDDRWIPKPGQLEGVVAGFHILDRRGAMRPGWGSAAVTFELPIPLEVPIGSFFQGNKHLLSPLFERVAQLVGKAPAPTYDLHAGVGFLAAAARCGGDRPLTLVEPNRIAAHAAARNLPGARVEIGATAEEFLESSAPRERDAVVMTDPPRRGLSRPQIDGLLQWRPNRLLMLGCDAATWSRDAGRLLEAGYGLRSIELYDLFPHTHHVEILATLESE